MNLLLALGSFLLGLSPVSVLAQEIPIEALQQRRERTISGVVGSVVGNSFVLSDGTGEVIVDAGPRWYQEVNLSPGEQITVAGEYDNGEFDAYRIIRATGDVIVIRSAPGRPPWAGGSGR